MCARLVLRKGGLLPPTIPPGFCLVAQSMGVGVVLGVVHLQCRCTNLLNGGDVQVKVFWGLEAPGLPDVDGGNFAKWLTKTEEELAQGRDPCLVGSCQSQVHMQPAPHRRDLSAVAAPTQTSSQTSSSPHCIVHQHLLEELHCMHAEPGVLEVPHLPAALLEDSWQAFMGCAAWGRVWHQGQLILCSLCRLVSSVWSVCASNDQRSGGGHGMWQVVVVGHTFNTQARKAVAKVPAAPAPPPRTTVRPQSAAATIATPSFRQIRPAHSAAHAPRQGTLVGA